MQGFLKVPNVFRPTIQRMYIFFIYSFILVVAQYNILLYTDNKKKYYPHSHIISLHTPIELLQSCQDQNIILIHKPIELLQSCQAQNIISIHTPIELLQSCQAYYIISIHTAIEIVQSYQAYNIIYIHTPIELE